MSHSRHEFSRAGAGHCGGRVSGVAQVVEVEVGETDGSNGWRPDTAVEVAASDQSPGGCLEQQPVLPRCSPFRKVRLEVRDERRGV